MRHAVNTLLWTAAFGPEHFPLLPRIRQWGFDGIEVARFDFTGFPASAVRAEAERHGLAVLVCTALTGERSLIDEDASVRRRTMDFLRSAIVGTAEMGGNLLVGPFCAPVGKLIGRRRNADEWARAVEHLQELAQTLDEHGVDLAVEPLNRFETYFLNTAQDGVALCEAVNHPRVGLLIDTFHSNIEEKSVADAYRIAGRHLKHVHTCENDRGVPGSGHVDWPGVVAAIREVGYDGWASIESFGSALPEIAAAACIWRDLAPSSDEIASEGLAFLHRAFAAERPAGTTLVS